MGIDGIAVYAGLRQCFAAFPVVEDPALTSIKAAVMYYGTRASSSSGSICRCSMSAPDSIARASTKPSHPAVVARGRAERAAHAAELRRRPSRFRAGGRQRCDAPGDRRHAGVRQAHATSARYQAALRSSLGRSDCGRLCGQTRKFREAAAAYASHGRGAPGRCAAAAGVWGSAAR